MLTLTILGSCMIGGGAKGLLDSLLKPKPRPTGEHTPVYIRD